jgi:hypothetical protein
MSELSTRMGLIKDALGAMYPDRIVTRDFRDPADRSAADLARGIYTLLSASEGNFTNVPGYSAQDGRQDMVIVADIQIHEDDAPSNVEDAEFDFVDEIKAFARSLPDTLCTMNLMSWVQSGQVAAPRGWVVFQLEYIP